MEEMLYRVERIDGDYALLTRAAPTDGENTANPVALALLPDDLREGELLVRRFLEYERAES